MTCLNKMSKDSVVQSLKKFKEKKSKKRYFMMQSSLGTKDDIS